MIMLFNFFSYFFSIVNFQKIIVNGRFVDHFVYMEEKNRTQYSGRKMKLWKRISWMSL